MELLDGGNDVHLAITGGTVGTEILAELGIRTRNLDLLRLHIWWIDDRFVPSQSLDRNDLQARQAWLDDSSLKPQNIHPFPSSDSGTIEDAAIVFSKKIEEVRPVFDLVLLGLGEDGHVASLFPGRKSIAVGDWIAIEKDSPKPPLQRLSLSLNAINSANEIMFIVSGIEKSDAVKEVLSGGSKLPAALVVARGKTSWLIDSGAASKLTSF
jgi:6-phosphogluconolactonase